MWFRSRPFNVIGMLLGHFNHFFSRHYRGISSAFWAVISYEMKCFFKLHTHVTGMLDLRQGLSICFVDCQPSVVDFTLYPVLLAVFLFTRSQFRRCLHLSRYFIEIVLFFFLWLSGEGWGLFPKRSGSTCWIISHQVWQARFLSGTLVSPDSSDTVDSMNANSWELWLVTTYILLVVN